MMQPLSRSKRRYYLIGMTLLFIVLTPILIFYATGYRLGDSLTLSRTGGLYVLTAQSGVQVYINDEFNKESSLFQKNILIQNLKPGTYKIRAEKVGEIAWEKELQVYPERVTEAYVFMLPQILEVEEVLPYVDAQGVATSSSSLGQVRHLVNPDIAEIKQLFLPPKIATTTKAVATSTLETKVLNKLALKRVGQEVVAEWQGSHDEQPSYFCNETSCEKSITLETPSYIRSFNFFPGRGDVVVVGLTDGIYAMETDNRSPQNLLPLFPGENLDLRVNGDRVYVKEGQKFYFLTF
jgi:hypothetical protein